MPAHSKFADAFNDHLEHLDWEDLTCARFFALVALVASAPATAQSWEEYAYSEYRARESEYKYSHHYAH